MYKIIETISITFAFYLLLFVLWTIFIVPVESSNENVALGSLLFLPHAARVIPVIYFGPWAIIGVLIAEFVCWQYIWPFDIFDRTGAGVLISTSAVGLTWLFFKLLDAELKAFGNLQNTNYKHVLIFVIFSSLFNGLGNGAYYPLLDETHQHQPGVSIRFVLGDILGTLTVIFGLVLFRKVTKDIL